jgi:hypothetical protein
MSRFRNGAEEKRSPAGPQGGVRDFQSMFVVLSVYHVRGTFRDGTPSLLSSSYVFGFR